MCGLSAVNKAYKRAVLRVHPDKHNMNDHRKHSQATELFKAVSEAFAHFKQAVNLERAGAATDAKPAAQQRTARPKPNKFR